MYMYMVHVYVRSNTLQFKEDYLNIRTCMYMYIYMYTKHAPNKILQYMKKKSLIIMLGDVPILNKSTSHNWRVMNNEVHTYIGVMNNPVHVVGTDQYHVRECTFILTCNTGQYSHLLCICNVLKDCTKSGGGCTLHC